MGTKELLKELNKKVVDITPICDELRKFDYYDYPAAVKADILCELLDSYTDEVEAFIRGELDIDELRNKVYDDLFSSDNVTGNGSGSYWISRFKAGVALLGNDDLYKDAINQFDVQYNDCAEARDDLYKDAINQFDVQYNDCAEARDVIIRCYLFPTCLDEVLTELDDLADNLGV